MVIIISEIEGLKKIYGGWNTELCYGVTEDDMNTLNSLGLTRLNLGCIKPVFEEGENIAVVEKMGIGKGFIGIECSVLETGKSVKFWLSDKHSLIFVSGCGTPLTVFQITKGSRFIPNLLDLLYYVFLDKNTEIPSSIKRILTSISKLVSFEYPLFKVCLKNNVLSFI